ncbi:Crp/Fnr family transcriptional regulator [uncultured Bacteroides sp.]|uniref:Crp/Fnr family transcriptional regulator n=1 Tax=uncultured Bacteroides sp. TaxID=162156 RepID=UPI002AAC38FB|nr:Crp/Fnr family transcriptional regulator [uncultured Bacteroides sp.]
MSIIKKYMELEGIAELRQFFIAKGTTREYGKNEFFMQRGQKHNHLGFILKGGFRYLGYTSDGNGQIVGYSFENDFVASYSSFQTQQPSIIDAQSVSNSTVLLLTYEDIKAFYDNCGFTNLRSKVAEILLNDSNNRLLSLYCDSPEERYQKLIKHYPDILNLVSLKEIASLIKIRPETLSRIRRKLSFQKNH